MEGLKAVAISQKRKKNFADFFIPETEREIYHHLQNSSLKFYRVGFSFIEMPEMLENTVIVFIGWIEIEKANLFMIKFTLRIEKKSEINKRKSKLYS